MTFGFQPLRNTRSVSHLLLKGHFCKDEEKSADTVYSLGTITCLKTTIIKYCYYLDKVLPFLGWVTTFFASAIINIVFSFLNLLYLLL